MLNLWMNWKLALMRRRSYAAIVVLSLIALMGLMTRDTIAFILVALVMLHPFSASHRNLVKRPLFFCLPGYRDVLRGMILTDALVGGVMVTACVALHFRGQVWSSIVLYGLTAFLVGFAVSLFGTVSELLGQILTPLLAVVVSMYFGGVIVVGLIAFYKPSLPRWLIWPAIWLVCIEESIFVLWRIRRMPDMVQAQRKAIEAEICKRARTDVKPRRTARSWMGDRLMARAGRCRPLGLSRYLWAGCYQALGPIPPYWKWALAGSVVLSFTAMVSVTEIAFAALGLAAVFIELPGACPLLLPGGRRERCYATLAAALGASVVLLAVAVFAAGLCEFIAAGLDEQRFGLRFARVWLAGVLVPWACLLKLNDFRMIRPGNRWPTVAVGLTIVIALHRFLAQPQTFLAAFTAIGLCGWFTFLLALRYVCMRGSLVGPRAREGGRI